MKKGFITTLILVSSLASFSQDSYTALDGAVIRGTLENYKEWSKNPTEVIFKNTDGAEISLTPQNCRDFSVGSDYFLSYNGTRISNTNDALSQGLQNAQMIKDSVHVFLRRIYQYNGFSLFKLMDNKRINFYIADSGSIKELEYFETMNNNAVIPFSGYKNYLQNRFSDVHGIETRIDKLSYKEIDLINFFAYVFSDTKYATEKSRTKYPTEVLLGAGANVVFQNLSNTSTFNLKSNDFSPSLEFAIRIYSQRNFGKSFFLPALNVMPLLGSFNKDAYNVKATMVTLSLGAGYMFVKKENISFYIQASGAMPMFVNYQTRQGLQSEYIKSNGLDARLTVVPEIGLLINKKIDVSLGGMIPVKLQFNSNGALGYKVSKATLAVKYAFGQKRSK